MNLLDASVPPSAITEDPYSVAELDALGDDRVWATIEDIRREHNDEIESLQETINTLRENSGLDREEAERQARFAAFSKVAKILNSDSTGRDKLKSLAELVK